VLPVNLEVPPDVFKHLLADHLALYCLQELHPNRAELFVTDLEEIKLSDSEAAERHRFLRRSTGLARPR
jgi:hypothetical protein